MEQEVHALLGTHNIRCLDQWTVFGSSVKELNWQSVWRDPVLPHALQHDRRRHNGLLHVVTAPAMANVISVDLFEEAQQSAQSQQPEFIAKDPL